MLKATHLLVFGMLLFLVGFVSADYVVMGTVYDGTAGDGLISGATVTVDCGSVSATDITGSDGLYAILFNDSDCNESHDWSVEYYMSGYKSFKGAAKPVNYSEMLNFPGLHSTVVDFVMIKNTYSGGGDTGGNSRSSGSSSCDVRFWNCDDWSACDAESQTRTCFSNCATIRTEEQACGIDNSQVLTAPEVISGQSSTSSPSGFFSAITGAVIGGGAGSWISVVVLVLLIGSGFWFVSFKRKK